MTGEFASMLLSDKLTSCLNRCNVLRNCCWTFSSSFLDDIRDLGLIGDNTDDEIFVVGYNYKTFTSLQIAGDIILF